MGRRRRGRNEETVTTEIRSVKVLTPFRQSVSKTDVRPIGEDGGDRTGNMEIQSGRAYGEAGTSVPRERVRSESPSQHAEDEVPRQGRR